jgi:hypothetical protein
MKPKPWTRQELVGGTALAPTRPSTRERIDDAKELELVGVRVRGTYLTESVLPHEDGRMEVVNDIAAEPRMRVENVGEDFCMSVGFAEQAGAGCRGQRPP